LQPFVQGQRGHPRCAAASGSQCLHDRGTGAGEHQAILSLAVRGAMIDRRTFLLAMSAAATRMADQDPRLETLTEWLNASPGARQRALQPSVERIRALDGAIQAWVQVAPEQPTGSGKLSGIPFGVKDIIETKGLSTEYGSPIYKGRIG